MTLDIIVTHYTEPWSVGKPLFDMIENQRMVDLDDVNVILVNDGSDNELPEECFKEYSYIIEQVSIPKSGVSIARNTGLDLSNADYVMFCDFDDSFCSLVALYLIFGAMEGEKYDIIWNVFYEEVMHNGRRVITPHDRDFVYIHGKVFRRKYLLDNGIRFNEKLTLHEDVYLVLLSQALCDDKRIYGIKTPYYLWKWNPNSVVRKHEHEDFILLTYDHLIRQRISVTEEFFKRGLNEHAMTAIIKTVIDTYYDCQQTTWQHEKNRKLLENAENWFAAYLKRYANYYMKADPRFVAGMAQAARENALKKGTFYMESETLEQWLKHIIKDTKPIPREEQNV